MLGLSFNSSLLDNSEDEGAVETMPCLDVNSCREQKMKEMIEK